MRTGQRNALGLLLALVVVAVVWWTQGSGSTPADPGTDEASGLSVVQLDDLPPEAAGTVELIDAGGPFPEDEDGGTFGNREELLPDRPQGYYTEYTVPTPGSDDRGARRIVAGQDGELYWTGDHYASFERIVR
jgi:ribonuclease T1